MEFSVCVIGLGYVGLTLSVYLAHNGMSVHGVEISDSILNALKRNKAHFYEENFDTLLKESISSGKFSFGKHYKSFDSQVCYIVTIGTPLGRNGKVNLGALTSVVTKLSEMLKDGDLIILRSTVKIGTTRDLMKPILDKSEKKYFLGFCPERTLEGSAFKELSTLPQIISGIDKHSLEVIDTFFKPFCPKIIQLPQVEEAEMTKLLNNSERDLMFALANEIALMADTKGLNAYRVIEAANFHYDRSRLKLPGPVGGPCLEKDPFILTESFIGDSHTPKLFTAGRDVNESIIDKSLDRFFKYFFTQTGNTSPKKIEILGFAFKGKPPTGDVRGSLVHLITRKVKNEFPYIEIRGKDYLATLDDIHKAGANYATNIIEHALENVDLVIIQNNHPKYAIEDWGRLTKNLSQNCMIYDFWNQLPEDSVNSIKYYIAFGNMK